MEGAAGCGCEEVAAGPWVGERGAMCGCQLHTQWGVGASPSHLAGGLFTPSEAECPPPVLASGSLGLDCLPLAIFVNCPGQTPPRWPEAGCQHQEAAP